MKTFCILSSVFSLAILSSVSGQFQVQQGTSDDTDVRFTATKNGRKLHDDFYKLIEAREPVESALNQALTWDVEAQYEHFQLLHDHVQAGDKYAKYCAEVIQAAQDLLDVTLKKIHIDRKVKICDYIKGLYDFESARPISPEMREVVSGINAYRNAVVKKLEEEQEKAKHEAAGQTPAESQAPNQPVAQDEKPAEEESDDDESDGETENITTASQGI